MPRSAVAADVNHTRPTESFAEIYETWFDFVWRSVRRLGGHPSMIDDLVQEVFLVVYQKLDTFEGRSTFKTWLFGITLRIVRERHRRDARRQEKQHIVPLLPEPKTPAAVAENNQAVALLHGLLAEMEESRRTVFIMSELEQMTVPEMAEVLGENINTIYSRLRVARTDFEERLRRHRAQEEFRTQRCAGGES